MTDDQWQHIPTAPWDPAMRAEYLDPIDDALTLARDPVRIASWFLSCLMLLDEERDLIEQFVTPESRPDWGDFQGAADTLAAIPDWGVATGRHRAFDAIDVAYVPIFSGVKGEFQVSSDGGGELVMAAACLTLVWRPEVQRWLIHQLGPQLRPEELTRTSPGEAPEDTPFG